MKKIVLLLLTSASLFVTAASHAAPTDTFIANKDKLPHYPQRSDYSELINPIESEMNIGGAVKYKDLPSAGGTAEGQMHVFFDKDNAEPWFVGTNPAKAPVRLFADSDLEAFTGGQFHCYPAVLAMVMEYFARTDPKLAKLGIAATDPKFAKLGPKTYPETRYIHEISEHLDTNDINPKMRKNDRGHLGTYGSDVIPGAQAFAKVRDPKVTLKAESQGFKLEAYVAAIKANKPVYLLFKVKGEKLAHGAVGYGYVTEDKIVTALIVSDPMHINGYLEMNVLGEDDGTILLSPGGFLTADDVAITEAQEAWYEPVTGYMITFDVEYDPYANTDTLTFDAIDVLVGAGGADSGTE